MRFRPALLAAVVAVATAVVAAGCGGGSDNSSGVASLASGTTTQSGSAQTSTTPASRQDFQAAILSYTRCMRANGVQMADPTFNGTGGGGLFRQRADRNNPKFEKAQTKCRSKLQAVRPQFTPAQQKQMQETALKFAQCMRKNGINVPDPDFSQGGGGPGGGLFGGRGINPRDPKVSKAFQACQKVFTGNGPGGFRFGGPPPGGGAPPGGSGS